MNADLIETKPISKSEFSARGFRERHPFADLLDLCPNPGIILDCGAGAGHFSKECDKHFQGATLYSFEPVPKLFEALEFASRRMINQRGCSQVALTDANAIVELNLTAFPKSSSLLGFLPGGPLEKECSVVETIHAKGIRLDTWMDINSIDPAKVGLLKMDVQGAEIKLLRGCPKLLAHKPVILTEVAFQAQYQDHPLIEELDEFLAEFGYRRLYLYASVRPEVWGDAIYVTDKNGHLPIECPTQEQLCDAVIDIARGTIRLNIGAGEVLIPGFTPIDRKFGTEAFPLNYADGSVEEIRCSHMLEHLSFAEVPLALQEWWRVLKPGGRLRIAVPDFSKISSTSSVDPMWPYYLMGGQCDQDDFHRSAYDEPRLSLYLKQAGFVSTKRWESANTDAASLPISLNLEAFKPEAHQPESQTIKIKAIMSIPRIGWNDTWQCITDMLRPFSIPVETFNGVFWGQCMQRSFQECVAQGVDWILCIDYDTMATARNLDELMKWFGQRPDIDALCALQMRRGLDAPILTAGGKNEIEVSDEPCKITTAHFGLTLIRVECLKDIPKPWFKSQPDEQGEWGDNRMDDDIWFWHQWRLAGKNIYLAPAARIGHLQLMVSEFGDDMEPRHVHVAEWRKNAAKK